MMSEPKTIILALKAEIFYQDCLVDLKAIKILHHIVCNTGKSGQKKKMKGK